MHAGLVNKHWGAAASTEFSWAWRLYSTLPAKHVKGLVQCPWPTLWWIMKPANLLPPLDCYRKRIHFRGLPLCQAPLKTSSRQAHQGGLLGYMFHALT